MKWLPLLLLLFANTSCERSFDPTPRPAPSTPIVPPVRHLNVAFQDQIKRDGSISFWSWNGSRFGMDDDTELKFFPDGKAELVEYGLGVSGYEGHYQLDDTGKLTAEFRDIGHPWPLMLLERDEKSLILKRADAVNARIMGNRIGATLSDGTTYWPFRPIPTLNRESKKLTAESVSD